MFSYMKLFSLLSNNPQELVSGIIFVFPAGKNVTHERHASHISLYVATMAYLCVRTQNYNSFSNCLTPLALSLPA